MQNYIGCECPICKQKFNSTDDIVVCPDCGAPYHRECYIGQGHCSFEDQHGSSFSWKRPEDPAQNGNGVQKCPRCGEENPATSLYCGKCGQSLGFQANRSADGQAQVPPAGAPYPPNANNPYQNQTPPPYTPPQGTYPMGGNPFDPMGGVGPKEDLGGVESGDVAKFVSVNPPYYMRVFSAIARYNKSKFNFATFLFRGGWFLYRKQYALGSILLGIEVFFSAINTTVAIIYTNPLVQSLSAQLPANTNIYSAIQDGSAAQATANWPIMNYVWIFFPMAFLALQLGFMIVMGIIANRLYFKFCVKSVKKIKNQNLGLPAYETALKNSGGVNFPLATSLMVCYFILYYLLPQILS